MHRSGHCKVLGPLVVVQHNPQLKFKAYVKLIYDRVVVVCMT